MSSAPPRPAGPVVLAALLALAAACEREPKTVVAAPASPPPATAPAHGANAMPGQAATAGRGAGSERAAPAPGLVPGAPASGPPSTAALVAQVDAMRAELDRREKPLEILVALGNLYFENGRYPDAIEWYRQAIEMAEPAWKAYLALPVRVRAAARPRCPTAAIRAGAARPGYAELSAAAVARARDRDVGGAAGCWRQALVPAIAARVQRGNAYLLAGDPARAVAEQEAVLERFPDDPEALWFLGLAVAESAQGDPGKLARAGALWDRLEKLQPNGPHAQDLKAARAELARRTSEAGRAR